MNTRRVAERGLEVAAAAGARLPGCRLAFNKQSRDHAGSAHANIVLDARGHVEGVLYRLAGPAEIRKMDQFERAPVNYSRELVHVSVAGSTIVAWTYFANPAVIAPGLLPERWYLNHLLAGRDYLSAGYYRWLAAHPCCES